jgi:hypothetical protein
LHISRLSVKVEEIIKFSGGRVMMLDATILRSVWSIIADLRNPDILYLSDAALIGVVLQQIAQRTLLNHEETGRLQTYLNTKLPLIRDMADGLMP